MEYIFICIYIYYTFFIYICKDKIHFEIEYIRNGSNSYFIFYMFKYSYLLKYKYIKYKKYIVAF